MELFFILGTVVLITSSNFTNVFLSATSTLVVDSTSNLFTTNLILENSSTISIYSNLSKPLQVASCPNVSNGILQISGIPEDSEIAVISTLSNCSNFTFGNVTVEAGYCVEQKNIQATLYVY